MPTVTSPPRASSHASRAVVDGSGGTARTWSARAFTAAGCSASQPVAARARTESCGRPLALVGYRPLAGWTATPWRSGLRRFRRALRPRSLLDDRALRRGYPVPAIPGPLGRGRRPPGQASAATCPRLLSPTRSAAHSWHGRPGRVARSRTGVERAARAGDRRSLGSGRGLVLCAAEPDQQVLRLPLELLEHPPLDALEARTYGLRVAGAEARAIHHAPPGRCLLADVRAMFCESILTCQART